jgi:hypothetical protein
MHLLLAKCIPENLENGQQVKIVDIINCSEVEWYTWGMSSQRPLIPAYDCSHQLAEQLLSGILDVVGESQW